MNPSVHRVFIAVLLPAKVKEDIRRALDLVPLAVQESFRFLSEENWHITLSFLGYQDSGAVAVIVEAAQAVTTASASFGAAFEEIIYGPPGVSPRLIWLRGAEESRRALGALQERLEDELARRGVALKRERRPFALHITLARLTRPLPPKEPFRSIPCRPAFKVSGIDLMESHLKRSGAEYASLAHFDFSAGSV